MQTTSWIDRIADEANLWLNAVKAEESGELARSAVLYLKDAQDSMATGMLQKAALSSSCAAGCLAGMGLQRRAHELYAESARIYLEQAQRVTGASVREYLWCLREAYRAFQHAGMKEKAQDIRRRYTSVAARIDPFVFVDALRPDEAVRLDLEAGSEAKLEDPMVIAEVERFLHPGRDGHQRANAAGSQRRAGAGRRSQNLEESITNQLG